MRPLASTPGAPHPPSIPEESRPDALPVTLGLAVTAALTSTATAHADATRLVDGRLIDATSDGRYVLYADDSGARLLDRTAGTTIPVPDGAEQLADRSPRILIKGADGYRVLDTTTGTLTLATLDESVNAVPATSPELVRDGRSVIFQTGTGTAARVLERRLDTASTVVRATGVTLLHASEDARVITWSRPLPPAFRPADQIALAADPAGGVPGTAVGYRVDDQARGCYARPSGSNGRPTTSAPTARSGPTAR